MRQIAEGTPRRLLRDFLWLGYAAQRPPHAADYRYRCGKQPQYWLFPRRYALGPCLSECRPACRAAPQVSLRRRDEHRWELDSPVSCCAPILSSTQRRGITTSVVYFQTNGLSPRRQTRCLCSKSTILANEHVKLRLTGRPKIAGGRTWEPWLHDFWRRSRFSREPRQAAPAPID